MILAIALIILLLNFIFSFWYDHNFYVGDNIFSTTNSFEISSQSNETNNISFDFIELENNKLNLTVIKFNDKNKFLNHSSKVNGNTSFVGIPCKTFNENEYYFEKNNVSYAVKIFKKDNSKINEDDINEVKRIVITLGK